jgi:chaperone required for assembly of F1-ATPase
MKHIAKTKVQFSFTEMRNGYSILRKNKTLQTPEGNEVTLPHKGLVNLYLEEKTADIKKPQKDRLTIERLIFTALDRVKNNKEYYLKDILNYASTDLILFPVGHPISLRELEGEFWLPALKWANNRFQTNFKQSTSIIAPKIGDKNLTALTEALQDLDDFQLSGLYAACQITGSFFLAFALYEKAFNLKHVLEAAQLHENVQAEQWGREPELIDKQEKIKSELALIERYLNTL